VNRRGFLKMFGLAAGGVLLDQAIPNGRVWSFPKDIVVAKSPIIVTLEEYADYAFIAERFPYYDKQALDALAENLAMRALYTSRLIDKEIMAL